jgi:hypothetical protein
MRTPLLFPPPLEYILIVDPLSELKENDPGPRLPVPEARTPVTVLEPPLDAEELFTVSTHVLSFAVTDVVPPKRRPVKVW